MIELTIRESPLGPGESKYLNFELRDSSGKTREFKSDAVAGELAEKFVPIYEELHEFGQRKTDIQDLESKGNNLARQLLPKDLHDDLWNRAKIASQLNKPAESLLIRSENPSIPWELLRIQAPGHQRRCGPGVFLAEAFALCRWIPSLYAPALALPVHSINLVWPEGHGLSSCFADEKLKRNLPVA